MEIFFGQGNSIIQYLYVLILYAAVFIIIRYPQPVVELNFRKNFLVLYVFWSISMFIGNYLFSMINIMSFLPWINNFLHTFIWVGFCLTFLYSSIKSRNIIEQFILFSVFSFIVKVGEFLILGTWEKDSFFFFQSKMAYIIIMSLVDGFYPIVSIFVLKIASYFIRGVYYKQN